jgi:hypothetical protein
MIAQVTYERLFNLGNYENLRLAATAIVESSTTAAFAEAKHAVEQQYELFLAERANAQRREHEEWEARQRHQQELYEAELRSRADEKAAQEADDLEDGDGDPDYYLADDTDDDDTEDGDADDDGFHL